MIIGSLVIIFTSLIVDLFIWINRISVHWSWNLSLGVSENFLWVLSKLDIQICSPCRFVKFFGKVSGWFSELFASIYCFAWSKISFKFFVQALFRWFFICVYHIYWISIYWSWNLSLSVLKNWQWDVSKPDIRIFFNRRFVRGCGEGSGFMILPVVINWLTGFKSIIPSSSSFQWCRQVSAQGAKSPIGLIPCNYFVSDLNIFNKNSSEFRSLSFINLSSCENKSRPKGQKFPLGKSLASFLCLVLMLLVKFLCLWVVVCFHSLPKSH